MSTPPIGQPLALVIPDELVDVLAERVTERLTEQQRPNTPELMTVPEAADLLRCKSQRVYDLMSQGRLKRLKDGSKVLIRRDDLLAYLERKKG